MLHRLLRSVFLVTALLLTGTPEAAADDSELPLPTLRWTKAFNALSVKIIPGGKSHLAATQPVTAQLDDGAYFRIDWTEPKVPESGSFVFRLPRVSARNSDSWTLNVSGAVCSDDGSRCLPFDAATEIPKGPQVTGRFSSTSGLANPEKSASESPPPGAAQRTTGDSKIAEAFDASQERAVPLLIDFYAQWCPPCERLKAEFLEVPEQQEILAKFVVLQVDADDSSSFELKDRYSVGGYPTVLIVSPDGETELDRIVGWSGSPEHLRARLEGLLSAWNTNAPLAPIQEARRRMAKGESAHAWEALRSSHPLFPEGVEAPAEDVVLALDIAEAVEAPETVELALRLADTARLPGEASAFLARAFKYLEETGGAERAKELKGRYGPRIATALESRLPVVTERGRGDASLTGRFLSRGPDDVERFDDSAGAAYHLAQWTQDQAAAQKLATGAAFRMAVAIALENDIALPALSDGRQSLSLPEHLINPSVGPRLIKQTGRVHDLVYLLSDAELPQVAEALIRRMVSLLPSEFTWHYKLGRLLAREERPIEAEAAFRTALSHSYGDNRLRAVKSTAELLVTLERVAEALALLEDTLKEPAPAVQGVRTHRYRKSLESLRDSLSSQVEP